MPETTLLLCYDGSEFARNAIARASELLASRDAAVLAVWQAAAVVPLALAGASAGGAATFPELDTAARDAAERLAEEGAERARAAGMRARAVTAQAPGPVWDTVIRVADELDVGAIVVGSRGLTGLKHVLLGSVSEGIVRHARRTTVVVQGPGESGERRAA